MLFCGVVRAGGAGQALMERNKAIKQWTKEPLEKNADVAMKIARSFHLTAQMKLLVEIRIICVREQVGSN